MSIRCAIPVRQSRVSSDAAWPLRGKDGLTYAERRRAQETLRDRVLAAMEN